MLGGSPVPLAHTTDTLPLRNPAVHEDMWVPSGVGTHVSLFV